MATRAALSAPRRRFFLGELSTSPARFTSLRGPAEKIRGGLTTVAVCRAAATVISFSVNFPGFTEPLALISYVIRLIK